MQFGNWKVTETGIEWKGEIGSYYIEIDRLHENGPGNRSDKYDWLLHVPEKTWVTRQDALDLNKAFLYAFEKYGIGKSQNLDWEATLAEQQEMFD